MTEAEFFAWEYKKHCMLATGMYLLWTGLCYDDKWDSISYLVKTGQAPAVSKFQQFREVFFVTNRDISLYTLTLRTIFFENLLYREVSIVS